MPYLLVNNIKIYYEVHGGGEPIALLNGILMTTEGWGFQVNALAKKFKVILHDFKGQGRSDKPKEEYSLEQHTTDFRKLLEYLHINKVHIIGISYGGIVALDYYYKYPESVKSLVLINVVCSPLTIKGITERWLEGCKTKDLEKFIDSWIRDIYSENFLSLYEKELRKRLMEVLKNFDFEAGCLLLQMGKKLIKRGVFKRYLEKIEVPTLIIVAENDALNSIDCAKFMNKEIRNSKLKIISNAGHGVIIEKPLETNEIILDFLLDVIEGGC